MTKTRGFEVVGAYANKDIHIPTRQTAHAAGYDFEAAADVVIPSLFNQYKTYLKPRMFAESVPVTFKPTLVPTGIKAYMPDNEYLQIENRSSNPIKQKLILANGVGIVDADYYNNEDNEGHIMFQFLNFGPEEITIHKGDRIGQGTFIQFQIADGDTADGVRTGGHGSTGK
jgi:dUTP pyrophosphatase